jgi:radical SAM protein with 4Fe4S-binding SPASM domain
MKKDTICAVPWMHLNFEPNGKVVPCCLTSTFNYFAGDLTTQSIDEVWNSDNMKKLRREMIEGKEPEICVKCFSREKVTGESGRIYHNKEFSDVLDEIPSITLEDGTCTKMELKYWDFRFSNLCNFKCRSCGPRYSSAWVPDAKKMNWPIELEKVTNIDGVDDKTNFDFLKEQVKHVRKIYFAGGEPLLMDEHWQILELLVENERFDVKLSYNTNCSMLTYGKKNVLDYWSQWEAGRVEVWPSIDEVGERAELIRSGTVWSKVENNLKELMALDNIIVRPGITVGAMNVFRLPEIITYLTDIGVINKRLQYKNFFINLLEWPQHYHVQILSDQHKLEIIKKINEFIDYHNKKYNTDISHLLTHILHELAKPHNPKSAEKFMHVTYQLDDVRDEDIFKTIPELDYIREQYESNNL